jgi:hypothetical protein
MAKSCAQSKVRREAGQFLPDIDRPLWCTLLIPSITVPYRTDMKHQKPRYPIKDLTGLLSIGRGSLYKEIKTGRLRTYLVGKRRFADPADVDAYVLLCRQEAPDSE